MAETHYCPAKFPEITKGESTDSVGSLVPVVFVIRANLTDLIQVVLKISC